MTNLEQRNLSGPDHARAIWHPPTNSEQRRVWSSWLKGTTAVVVSCAAIALFLASGSITSPLEATSQMERLAEKLKRVKVIPPETARELTRLIGQPRHDCNQVACSTQLQVRNSAARARLRASLAKEESTGDTQTTEVQATLASDESVPAR